MFPYLRSDVTGNCLYSSASLVQVGNNSLMESLRVLTSIELFNNAEFYSQHPCFSAVVNEHAECFSKSINNLLPMSASEECSDTGCTKANLVRPILNCNEKKWSSFLCILGLASVLNKTIFTYYPDCGEHRFKLLFNRIIQPRLNPRKKLDDLHILFCYEGTVTPGTVFQSNHFVPLLFHTQQPKRKYVAASSQASANRQKLCPDLSKKASNITKFFNVAEKPVLKPKSQDNSKLDLDKSSTSTNTKTKTSVLKSDETPIAKKVKLCPTNFDVAMYRDMVKGMSSSEICNLIKNVFRPDKKYPFPKSLFAVGVVLHIL